jgi:hypothetical protein
MQQLGFPTVQEEKAQYEVEQVKKVKSAYENVYWLARALVGSEYGGKGSNSTTMLDLSQRIDTLLAVPNPKLEPSKQVIWDFLRS